MWPVRSIYGLWRGSLIEGVEIRNCGLQFLDVVDRLQNGLDRVVVVQRFSCSSEHVQVILHVQQVFPEVLHTAALHPQRLSLLVQGHLEQFMLMQMMHSEDIAIQDQSVPLFKDCISERIYEYAIKHRDIIQRFGRFPHRNEILGRISTEEEIEFLKQPGSSF